MALKQMRTPNNENVEGIPRMMVKRMLAAQNRNEDNPARREWSEGPRQTKG